MVPSSPPHLFLPTLGRSHSRNARKKGEDERRIRVCTRQNSWSFTFASIFLFSFLFSSEIVSPETKKIRFSISTSKWSNVSRKKEDTSQFVRNESTRPKDSSLLPFSYVNYVSNVCFRSFHYRCHRFPYSLTHFPNQKQYVDKIEWQSRRNSTPCNFFRSSEYKILFHLIQRQVSFLRTFFITFKLKFGDHCTSHSILRSLRTHTSVLSLFISFSLLVPVSAFSEITFSLLLILFNVSELRFYHRAIESKFSLVLILIVVAVDPVRSRALDTFFISVILHCGNKFAEEELPRA